MLQVLFARLGESDCETIDAGFFAQPVNALSSFTFSIIGLVVSGWSTRVQGHERVVRIGFGSLMVMTGLGSVLFHGPQGPGSQFGHDVTFLVTVMFIAVLNVSEAYHWRRPIGWAVFGVGSVVLGLSLIASSSLTNVLMVIVVAALVTSDIALHRRGRIRTTWYVASLVLTAAAVIMFLLGRTGALLCDPESLFQGHALWHALAALALGSYFVATSDARVYREGRSDT